MIASGSPVLKFRSVVFVATFISSQDGLSLVDCLVDNPVSGLQWLFCLHARMVVILHKGPLSQMLREINGLKNRTHGTGGGGSSPPMMIEKVDRKTRGKESKK